jgi:glutamate racemase
VLAHVGIFDSGIGGLTVARALHSRVPMLPIRYLADTAFFPYGSRDPVEVSARALTLGQSLVDQGCMVLVVACNTASSAALELLRAKLPVPVVGMAPPLKPAAEQSRSGRVLVLATEGTVAGERLAELEANHARDVTVEMVPMPGLADLVELGEASSDRVRAQLSEAVAGPVALGADAVALGCTHYGFVAATLRGLLPDSVMVIDAADAVARRTVDVIRENGLVIGAGDPLPVMYEVTGDVALFDKAMACLREAGEELPPMVDTRKGDLMLGGAR